MARIYRVLTTREYATLYGVSERTARRHLAKDRSAAVRLPGKGYRVAVPATEISKRSGISAKAARRGGIRVDKPSGVTQALRQQLGATLTGKGRAFVKALEFAVPRAIASNKNQPKKKQIPAERISQNITERFSHATQIQLERIAALDDMPYDDWNDDYDTGDEWMGDDDESILYYHDR